MAEVSALAEGTSQTIVGHHTKCRGTPIRKLQKPIKTMACEMRRLGEGERAKHSGMHTHRQNQETYTNDFSLQLFRVVAVTHWRSRRCRGEYILDTRAPFF